MNKIAKIIESGRKTISTLLITITVTLALLPVGARAQADVRGPNLFQGFAGLSPTVAAGVRSNQTAVAITNNAVALKPGSGLAFTAAYTPASSTTANVVYEIALSYDGTNYCTDSALYAVFVGKGTAAVRYHTNWPASLFDGARFASLTAVSNATAVSVTLGGAGLSVVK